jgi:phosphopantetheinyl transferase
MPLRKIEIDNKGGWALWQIDQTEIALTPKEELQLSENKITHPKKKLEWLASRMLIEMLVTKLGFVYRGIYKDENGKPFLKNSEAQISLSHSYPYVAAIVSNNQSVGIDIEKPTQKIMNVAHRVFNEKEREDANGVIEKNCVYWCAKEVLYKLHGKRGISFIENLAIDPFTLSLVGELNASINTIEFTEKVTLRYLIEKDVVTVFTKN